MDEVFKKGDSQGTSALVKGEEDNAEPDENVKGMERGLLCA